MKTRVLWSRKSGTRRLIMDKPVLVRLPSSHRGNYAVERVLGYEPHAFRSFRREGYWAKLPQVDADKLLAVKLATHTRVDESELHGVWYQPDPYRHTPPKDETCEHKPERLYELVTSDGTPFACCCECGTTLKGAA
jgi:hypothetical protein